VAGRRRPSDREGKADARAVARAGAGGPPPESAGEAPIRVVGIGCSAGGLEALEALLPQLPADLGVAFVVVSHGSSGHVSLLSQILARVSSMPVVEVADGTTLSADRLFVTLPGHHVRVEQGRRLRVEEPPAEHGPPLPIDLFLRSLAQEWRDNAAAIILSGTGSDGTLGVQAIKAESGLVLIQDERSARFPGMPASAIATGRFDFVLPPQDMAKRLRSWAQAAVAASSISAEATIEVPAAPFERILDLVRSHGGHDFRGYKTGTLVRRIERRRAALGLAAIEDYVRYVEEHTDERGILFRDFLIGATSFFREPAAFDALAAEALLPALSARSGSVPFRGWVAACSTGEEAYSLAILLHECADRLDADPDVRIFATDLDAHAIEVARGGRYPEGIAADVSKERLRRFFVAEAGRFAVKKEIRERIIFSVHDLLEDPPFTRVDFISCRNLLIYLKPEEQARLLSIFHYALNPGGILFLGSSETLVGDPDDFETVDRRWRIYRRAGGGRRAPAPLEVPFRPDLSRGVVSPSAGDRGVRRAGDGSQQVRGVLASIYAPPSVLVDRDGELLHVHGRTGLYLEPAPGEARLNLLDMAREGLGPALQALLKDAERLSPEPARRRARVKTNGDWVELTLIARHVGAPPALAGGILVSFERDLRPPPPPAEAGSEPPATSARIAVLEQELHDTRAELQGFIEELQSANEELASSHEEVQSANEELQSANEELETSREELQSLNEELQTVNSELRAKVNDLSQSRDDLANLLNSTEIATLFLDGELHIKRFTPEARKLVSLRDSDVGRPLADLATELRGAALVADAEQVMETLKPRESRVETREGRHYLMRMLPYRTAANVIEGLVISFIDLSQTHEAELAAERARRSAEAIVETIGQPLLVLDSELAVSWVNRAFARVLGVDRERVAGNDLETLGPAWGEPRVADRLRALAAGGESLERLIFRPKLADGTSASFLMTARRIDRPEGEPQRVLVALEAEPNDSSQA
jgi:two-component system, chemotaxis family, CheB/CheR fusion protein